MVDAWNYALNHCHNVPTADDIVALGKLVEPYNNARGYRECGVRVGPDIKGDWRLVPRQIDNLLLGVEELKPAEWYRLYEECHPFIDGNGRTGQILFNWIGGTLENPEWAPDFWGDYRRQPGAGAPANES